MPITGCYAQYRSSQQQQGKLKIVAASPMCATGLREELEEEAPEEEQEEERKKKKRRKP